MANPISFFERDKLEEIFEVRFYEPFKERPEQRERLRVVRGAYQIGELVADGFHFTKEELEQKLKKLLENQQSK